MTVTTRDNWLTLHLAASRLLTTLHFPLPIHGKLILHAFCFFKTRIRNPFFKKIRFGNVYGSAVRSFLEKHMVSPTDSLITEFAIYFSKTLSSETFTVVKILGKTNGFAHWQRTDETVSVTLSPSSLTQSAPRHTYCRGYILFKAII